MQSDIEHVLLVERQQVLLNSLFPFIWIYAPNRFSLKIGWIDKFYRRFTKLLEDLEKTLPIQLSHKTKIMSNIKTQ